MIHYRSKLYEHVSRKFRTEEIFDQEVDFAEGKYEAITKIQSHYFSLQRSPQVLTQQILARCRAVFEYFRRESDWVNRHLDSLGEEDFWRQHDWFVAHLRETLKIPEGVYGLLPEAPLPRSWLRSVKHIVSRWVRGKCTYDECIDVLWLLDELYDLDLHWILFDIPNKDLPRLGYGALVNFVYCFGMRAQSASHKHWSKSD